MGWNESSPSGGTPRLHSSVSERSAAPGQCSGQQRQEYAKPHRPPTIVMVAHIDRFLTAKRALHHDASMRTTVTLVPDVERLIRNAMEQSGQSFKEVLNQAILKGLANESLSPDEEPFVVASRPMGLRPGYDAGRLNSLADDLEAEAFLALTKDLLNRTEEE